MIYVVTGVNMDMATALFRQAQPILKSLGAPVDLSTVAAIPATVIATNGDKAQGVSPVTFGFPPFDALKAHGLMSVAQQLADILRVPCYAIGTTDVAFPL